MRAGRSGRACWTLIVVPVATFIFFDQRRFIGLIIELVDDKRLRRPVSRAFCPAPQADVAFWLCFIAAHFPLEWDNSALITREQRNPGSHTFLHSKQPVDLFGIVTLRVSRALHEVS